MSMHPVYNQKIGAFFNENWDLFANDVDYRENKHLDRINEKIVKMGFTGTLLISIDRTGKICYTFGFQERKAPYRAFLCKAAYQSRSEANYKAIIKFVEDYEEYIEPERGNDATYFS